MSGSDGVASSPFGVKHPFVFVEDPPLSPTFTSCWTGLGPWRCLPIPGHQRNVGPTVGPCWEVWAWPAEKTPPRRQDAIPRYPKTMPLPTATDNIKWCPLWCRDSRKVPNMVPNSSHRPGIGRRQSAEQEAKTGRRKWRPALELRDVMPSSITTSAAEGTGLEPATPYGAPHFQCASSLT